MSVVSNVERYVVPSILQMAAELGNQDPLWQHLRLETPNPLPSPTIAEEFIETISKGQPLPLGIEGQVDGDWFSSLDQVPIAKPTWYPTGALLSRKSKTMEPGEGF